MFAPGEELEMSEGMVDEDDDEGQEYTDAEWSRWQATVGTEVNVCSQSDPPTFGLDESDEDGALEWAWPGPALMGPLFAD